MNYKHEYYKVNNFIYEDLTRFKLIRFIILTDGTAIVNSKADLNKYKNRVAFKVNNIINLKLGYELRCIELVVLTNGQVIKNMNYETNTSYCKNELLSYLRGYNNER